MKRLYALVITAASVLPAVAQLGTISDGTHAEVRAAMNTALANGVAITGTYTNPAWLVSIPASKVTNGLDLSVARNANLILAGPSSGAAAAPTWRAILAADLPFLSAVAASGSAADLTTGTLAAARLPALSGDATTSAGSAAVTVSRINGVALSGLATGIMKNTTSTGVPSIGVAGADYVAPGGALGTPSSGVLTNTTGLPLATGVTGVLPLANGGTGTATPSLVAGSNITITGTFPNQTITAASGASGIGDPGANGIVKRTALNTTAVATAGTDYVAPGGALGTPSSGTLTNATGLPVSTGVSGLGTGVAAALATPSSANLATALTDETGTGAAVFASSPTLVTPNLGTPSAAVLTNATGLPISTGISGLGTGVGTFLGTPTSANLAAALTNETGSGAAVFANSPVLVTPDLGTPSAGVLTNATGLPIVAGTTGILSVARGGTGTATPGIVAGTNVTVSGTWPNQTVNATAGSATTPGIIFATNAGILCNGTNDDTAAIQSAINNANTTILFSGGVCPHGNLTMTAAGVTLAMNATKLLTKTGTTGIPVDVSGANISVYGGVFDGNHVTTIDGTYGLMRANSAQNLHLYGTTLQNVGVVGDGSYLRGFYNANSTGGWHGGRIDGAPEDCAHNVTNSPFTYDGGLILRNCSNGIYLQSAQFSQKPYTVPVTVGDVKIQDIFNSHNGTGSYGNGVVGYFADGFKVNGATIERTEFSGIRFNTSINAQAVGNTIRNAGDWGIYSEFQAGGILAVGNTVTESAGGINAANGADANANLITRIEGNIVRDMFGFGTNLTSKAYGDAIFATTGSDTANNTVDGAPYGIVIEPTALIGSTMGARVSNNTITDSRIITVPVSSVSGAWTVGDRIANASTFDAATKTAIIASCSPAPAAVTGICTAPVALSYRRTEGAPLASETITNLSRTGSATAGTSVVPSVALVTVASTSTVRLWDYVTQGAAGVGQAAGQIIGIPDATHAYIRTVPNSTELRVNFAGTGTITDTTRSATMTPSAVSNTSVDLKGGILANPGETGTKCAETFIGNTITAYATQAYGSMNNDDTIGAKPSGACIAAPVLSTTGEPVTLAAPTNTGVLGQIPIKGTNPGDITFVDFQEVKTIPAANCVSSTAGSGWSTSLTPACTAGTNNLGGNLPFADASTAQFNYEIPGDWNTAAAPYIAIHFGSGSNTSGTVIYNVQTACTKNDGSVTSDPAFTSAVALPAKTMAAATRHWSTSGQMTNVTTANNCVGGGTMLVKITRATDTAASTVPVDKAVITFPRRLTTTLAAQ